MLGLEVTVPIACFRKGFAREYWETEDFPPPATCYGFLLSMVGERDRRRHIGARVCPALFESSGPERSVVLRTLWRVKERASLPGVGTNSRPDYQELLTNVQLAIWLDSSEERVEGPSLEERVGVALDHPERIERYGGLSLGESTHLVDQVDRIRSEMDRSFRVYLLADRGHLTLPVWVDHVGSSGTRYVTGDLVTSSSIVQPPTDRIPRIEPP
jgi:CRISPR-associated protein Cas5t